MSDNGNALDLRARVDDSGRLARHGLRALVADLWAEVQRLTAELALKDQALDEIKERVEAAQLTVRAPYKLTEFDLGHIDRDLREIQRVLTRLDTQGETK